MLFAEFLRLSTKVEEVSSWDISHINGRPYLALNIVRLDQFSLPTRWHSSSQIYYQAPAENKSKFYSEADLTALIDYVVTVKPSP